MDIFESFLKITLWINSVTFNKKLTFSVTLNHISGE